MRQNIAFRLIIRYDPNQQSSQQDDMILQLANNLGFNFGDDVDEG
jgi:hypothetical protein